MKPGIDLVQDFIAAGEWGVVDVLEAWRTCAAAVAAFEGLTVRELLEHELAYGRGLDVPAPEETIAFVRSALLDGGTVTIEELIS